MVDIPDIAILHQVREHGTASGPGPNFIALLNGKQILVLIVAEKNC